MKTNQTPVQRNTANPLSKSLCKAGLPLFSPLSLLRSFLLLVICTLFMQSSINAQTDHVTSQDVKVNYQEPNMGVGVVATYAIKSGFEGKKYIKFDSRLVKVDEITFQKKTYAFSALPDDAKKTITGDLDNSSLVKVFYSLYNDNQLLGSGATNGLQILDWGTMLQFHPGNSINGMSELDTRSEKIWREGKLTIKIDKTELYPARLFLDFGDWLAHNKK